MINYVEKGLGLHLLLESAGYFVQHGNEGAKAMAIEGDQSQDIDTVVQSIIDNYDPLPDAKAKAISEVKTKANELILARLPIWKQNNMQAEALLILSKPQRGKGELTADDLARLDEIDLANNYPKAIRAQSNIDEELINSQADWKMCKADFSGMELI